MITSVLQMLVFIGAACIFAWYLLRIDKRENPPIVKRDDRQQAIDFESAEKEEHRAAMSHV
jgi:hypothetical protein